MGAVELRVKGLIEDIIRHDASEIAITDNFEEDLEMDELDKIELFISVEAEFNLEEIPENAICKIKTVKNLVDYIEQNKSNDE